MAFAEFFFVIPAEKAIVVFGSWFHLTVFFLTLVITAIFGASKK